MHVFETPKIIGNKIVAIAMFLLGSFFLFYMTWIFEEILPLRFVEILFLAVLILFIVWILKVRIIVKIMDIIGVFGFFSLLIIPVVIAVNYDIPQIGLFVFTGQFIASFYLYLAFIVKMFEKN